MSSTMQKVFMCLIAASLLVVTGAKAEPTYVGTDACSTCHSSIVDNVWLSGHPHKLTEVVDGVAPLMPYPNGDTLTVPDPWGGMPWDSVSYMIGGFNWKARFLDTNGWIVTGDEVQYNLETQGWVGYHADEARGTKPYNCGTCHTTGWQPDTSLNHDDLSLHQDSLAGIWGTWTEPGVRCEGCHGPGSDHIAGPSAANIGQVTTEKCGTCHSRGDVNVIDVKGGLIRHHEQYEEILLNSAPHDECSTCHAPHTSTVHDLGGITDTGSSCGSAEVGCHAETTLNPVLTAHGEMPCYSCHMPYTSKNAVSTGEGVYLRGDLRGHRMKIAITEKVAADTMITPDGGAIAGDFVTLDFACLQCHNGVDAPQRDMAWAAASAKLVHAAAPQEGYVGADACKVCHSVVYDEVFDSGHPYKLNKVVDGTPPTYPFSEVPNTPSTVTWDSVTYVIGGYNWKARFLDSDGWIITGDEVQYNLATQGWVGYHADEARGTKPYDCGSCHTTGWVPDESPNGENLSMHQDSLAGIWGTWSETGVTCEGCHGPGGEHASGPSTLNIGHPDTETCGTCHRRGDVNIVEVKGGLIRHHEQYEEILLNGAPHDNCMTCHDAHKSTVNDLGGITEIGASCGSAEAGCHAEVEVNAEVTGHGELECYSCHMPYTSKNAVSTGSGLTLAGDLRGHRMKIAVTEKVAADTMLTLDGGSLAGDFVTLDFACLQCHNGVDASLKDMAWAAEQAAKMHAGPVGVASSAVPVEFSLHQNAPNPFNPSTTIRFALPEAASVNLVIYNLSGQVVRELLNENVSAGTHDIVWNAKDNTGSQVASGVYIYRLESSVGSQVRRMLLVR
jgi:hypothetical protein